MKYNHILAYNLNIYNNSSKGSRLMAHNVPHIQRIQRGDFFSFLYAYTHCSNALAYIIQHKLLEYTIL